MRKPQIICPVSDGRPMDPYPTIKTKKSMASVSMTSIPPDFFDEERDKVFQMEIIQDSLVERIDKLIKKSSEVDARLDIIEEEMEEQTKISINGKS